MKGIIDNTEPINYKVQTNTKFDNDIKMKEIPIIFWCKLSQSFDNFSKVLLERKYLLRSNQVEDIRCSKEKFHHFGE